MEDAQTRGGRLRTLVFAALPALVVLAVCDLGIRYWYGVSAWTLATDVLLRHSGPEHYVFDGPLARADPVVGYACIPGVHRIILVRGVARLPFRVTIGSDGYRVAGPDRHAGALPEVWIFGCSYTWGLGLDDDQTFPWLVQSAMPGATVHNFGGNGYGNVQALLLLRHAVESKARLPRIAVVVYNDFDVERNVGAPSYLRGMDATGEAFRRSGVAVPFVSIGGDGRPEVRWFHLFHGETIQQPEAGRAYALRVTDSVLDEIDSICSAHEIAPILAVQSQPEGDPVVTHAREKGYIIANLFVDLNERAGRRYRLLPVDGHPNSRADRVYADKLLPVLRGVPR